VRLDRLADALDGPRLLGDRTTEVTSVVHDLADVRAGSLFCCVPGSRVDGHDLAPEALSRGAAALVVEHELPDKAPQLVVRSTRAAMGPVAAELHGHPSRRLLVCGVTGTNGKTTTVAFLTAMLEAGGLPTLTIGSLSPRQPGRPPNTPEAPELQAQLAAAVDAGKQAVAMEVSSIGLEQHRLDGTWFSVGVFTNLTQDHLEFHGDMESYYRAKRSLFTAERIGAAAVNRDDEWGRRLLGELEGAPFPVTTFSVESEELPVSLAGVHNQSNAQAALAAALAVGVDRNAALAGLATVETVPGRMETVHAGQEFAALVDYAHTPDALERALQAARELAGGNKVLVVFGCGGDRDHGKRPLMGRIATDLADVAVLTSDNPRSEDPMVIIDEVRAGAGRGLVVEPDRAKAIRVAVEHAKPGDVVVVTGKGHETGQEAGGVTVPFDDREELAAAIRETSR
jgi:UDP-N-acetylmuramoyl-L-alanyl-D-glutamate--2,6-diaminopimelate ligase